MPRNHILTALLLSALFALAASTVVLAKEDAVVTFDAALPSDPPPGSEITIGWTLEMPGMTGELEPFNADAVFIRLSSATGEPVDVVGRQDQPGHYVATFTVPSAGISRVEIGLRGESCTAGVCQRSDIMFASHEPMPQVADPAAAVAEPSAVAPPEAVVDATSPVAAASALQPLGVVGLALAAGALALALIFRRARGRALTPGASRS